MPILGKEADQFPENLLEMPAEAERPWWALYTLPRREKELLRRLQSKQIHFCCPMIEKRNRSGSGRVRKSFVPLFPSYVFLCGTHEDRYEAQTTNCVSRWIQVPDPERLVHDLRQVRRLIDTGSPLTPESRLEPGMRVRVKSGSLMGMEGVVIRRHTETRLLVAVDFLQRGASVLIDDFQVEPLV